MHDLATVVNMRLAVRENETGDSSIRHEISPRH
jgi:hypothetical protein